ncbi:hypothetical protein [Candidatus Albibeggiatoa sp. nov. NOAA]|uniref:hypothetical protein n=1 Tax=Candidatus Albibeggiatoa sp. nov. NOAA TaxID=3162724 RepID=UPI0032F463D0|nr:hypothetical protein [Thiotrichaceae bacterium]
MLDRFLRKSSASPQRYLHKRQDIIEPSSKSGKREWVIARSLCFYRVFDLTAIPAARRSEALKLKIRQWTPLTQYANYIVWQGALAQVWIWDAQKQTEQQQEFKIKSAYSIPETLLQPKLEQGIQLVQCMEGVEAQYWQDNILKHSRWWPNEPSLKQWIDFQRTCSLEINTDMPQPINAALSNKPWGYHRTSLNTIALQQEHLWVMLGLAIFIIVLAWYSVTIFKWQQAIAQVEQQIETLSDDATPILTAKTQAVQNKQTVERLANLNRYPQQLDLMGKVINHLPSKQVTLVGWKFELGKLSFTVEGDSLDPRQYVKAYEKVNWFEDVKTENTRENNQLRILMQVKSTLTNPDNIQSTDKTEPTQTITTDKIDVEKLKGTDGGFDWSNVPIPDFK